MSIFALSLTLNSCTPDLETTAGKMIGDWETVSCIDNDWWYYINEDGTQTETFYYNEEYSITPESEDWLILRISSLALSIIDSSDEETSFLHNIPFTYSLKDNNLTSLLLQGDHTNTVTVSFIDQDTMVFYMKDCGDMNDGNRGYEHYESWTTYRRVK